MTIVFISNYLNHHIKPLTDAFYKLIGNKFTFISCEEFPQTRQKLGLEQSSKQEYEYRTYEEGVNQQYIDNLVVTSDIVIFGSSPKKYYDLRRLSEGTNIRYSERIFKKGILKAIINLDLLRAYKFYNLSQMKNEIYLCASAYAARDFRLIGIKSTMLKWGYFPYVNTVSWNQLYAKKSLKRIRITWAGRLINWKHPEQAILLAQYLRKTGHDFCIDMYGEGDMEVKLRNKIVKCKLNEYVILHGAIANDILLSRLEETNIFIHTSDFGEGWGAVINEAMAMGCIVVASSYSGAAPFLIEDRYNGYLYENQNIDEFCIIVSDIMKSIANLSYISKNAYETIKLTWNGITAAERFIKFFNERGLINYQEGPMSTI